ncbi:MAG TPA: DegQ family serine endoprotease [Bryobacteraceae bacterium]|nr:DegQ family serine endoprotease [Bryobacteraceae bacterium]
MKIQGFWGRPAVMVLAAALGLGGVALVGADHMGMLNPPATMKFASPDEPASRNTFAPVVKKVLPAVVSVSSSKMVKTGFADQGDMDMDPLFRQFFGDGQGQGQGRGQGRQFNVPRQRKAEGLGSGVIVSPEGYILTNNHVVDGSNDVHVTLSDRREFKAQVIGTDPKTDVAVLKIDAPNLQPIVIGDSDRLQVGDYVLAMGNPFGLGKTVTMGIVSATGRGNLGIEEYENFIQTDASINPGNSGGALVNDRGELVGINTAILSHGSEGNQGIGFAVPVSVARNVMDQILKTGKVTRAYLGVVAQEVTPAIARAFHEPEVRGALVGDVSPNSPAERAGLHKGDIILEVNGKPVNDGAQLRMNISLMEPGTTVGVKVLRDGSQKDFSVRLAELPTEQAKVEKNTESTDTAMEGVSVENLNARSARELGLPATATGVVVTEVEPGSRAAESGLKRGDLIQEVNHQAVKNTSDFERALGNSKDEALLLVNRQGSTHYVAV